MKIREQFMGEKQANIKLRKERKSIWGIEQVKLSKQQFGMSWKWKKTMMHSATYTGLIRKGQKTIADEKTVKKNPKSIVSAISSNLHQAGVKVSPFKEAQIYKPNYKIQTSSVIRIRRLEFTKSRNNRNANMWRKMWSIYSWSKSYTLMKLVSWIVHAWLLLEQTH